MAQPISPTYTSLEGKSLEQLGVTLPTFSGNDNSFYTTTTFIYTLFFTAIVIAAFYRYVVAGALRMQASEVSIRKSNEVIKKTTLGLLGVFSLFLLLFTVNKDMVTGNVDLSEIRAKGGAVQAQPPAPAAGAPTGGNYAAKVASHNAVVARLSPSNIHTNHGDAPCTEGQLNQTSGIPPCTSLVNLSEESIQLLLAINSSCRCTLVVTGGTEPGHQTHGETPGKNRAIDLRLGGPRGDSNNTDPLYTFIKSVATNKLGANSNCFERYLWRTFTFCDEKPPNDQHFHVN